MVGLALGYISIVLFALLLLTEIGGAGSVDPVSPFIYPL